VINCPFHPGSELGAACCKGKIMSTRPRANRTNTAFQTTQEDASPEEIATVKAFLNKAADNLYGHGEQLSAKEVEMIARESIQNLHKRPPGYR
jgi:signal-transduction protein with cAMP-binding, CBS, and nucleotidyltransferase domain